jgi:type II secretory pathway pseudopilin PulG
VGLLSTIAIASLGSARAKARDGMRYAGIASIKKALDLYYLDHGQYPAHTTTSGFEVSTENNFMEYLSDYLAQIPIDPTNSGIYVYSYMKSSFCSPSDGYILGIRLETENFIQTEPPFDNPDLINPKDSIPNCGIYFIYRNFNFDYVVGGLD